MSANSPFVLFEACVESMAEAVAAERGGAGRIELCVDLAIDGTTPPAAMIGEVCRAVKIPVMVLVRPRGGDFHYSPHEVSAMCEDIGRARSLGAAGVVIGALAADGGIDRAVTECLVKAARPMSITFHRAFDVVPDRIVALETLIALGVDRVLTSGGATTAEVGVPELTRLVERAAGRIGILAGGRVRAENVGAIVQATGVREVHAHTDAAAMLKALRR
ncbi:MAG TPA: copper homeostasis protein CutC [Gemmatimonadales bacterium]|nr:copper homeostasis protein CutC [Gemmatimonadales bacterium]